MNVSRFDQLIRDLSTEEIDVLETAIEQTKSKMLWRGAKFDFFGGAKLDLDSIFVDPRERTLSPTSEPVG
ncbi:hypothetical protein [Luteimonas sp. SDU101]|uniref:hypothetical protein n=1 Tax=Luteimonas sp. SDU101 TaxID=3422593 RepID=UPI003EBE7B81